MSLRNSELWDSGWFITGAGLALLAPAEVAATAGQYVGQIYRNLL